MPRQWSHIPSPWWVNTSRETLASNPCDFSSWLLFKGAHMRCQPYSKFSMLVNGIAILDPSIFQDSIKEDVNKTIWRCPKIGIPQIIHVNRNFHCKPSILGCPHFRKPPYLGISCDCFSVSSINVPRNIYIYIMIGRYWSLNRKMSRYLNHGFVRK